MQQRPDPTPPADAAEIEFAKQFLDLPHGVLSYIGTDGLPGISRIGIGRDVTGYPVTLISALAPHWAGLRAHPDCAILLGEPGPKGDPLTHPRLMMRARASFAAADARPALRASWLAAHPKAKLYIDFTDFDFVSFTPTDCLLNAGFGKARRLTPQDLRTER
jgi:putative heme iron utilization protein